MPARIKSIQLTRHVAEKPLIFEWREDRNPEVLSPGNWGSIFEKLSTHPIVFFLLCSRAHIEAISPMTIYTDMVQVHAIAKPQTRPAGPPLLDILALAPKLSNSYLYKLSKRLLE